MHHRRHFLGSALSFAGLALTHRAALAQEPALRGALDGAGPNETAIPGSALGVRPGADDITVALQRAIDQAAAKGRPLYLAPGRYVVSGLTLPSGAHLIGAPGATRLVHAGGGHLIVAEGADRIGLSNLTLDGQSRPLRAYAHGLFHAVRCRRVTLDGIEVLNGPANGIVLDGCQGRVERSTIAGMADTGLLCLDARGLQVTNNIITGAGNNGIRVWRTSKGDDGTLISGNRIEGVRATSGGNGQNGNGINIFRADGVTIANNRVSDCAFSAIRDNAGANCEILGNTALRSGEVAIFVEFGFDGALVAHNIVDGAAAGISITNSKEGGRLAVVNGNIVRNLTASSAVNPDTFCYGVGAEADTAVSANVVENLPGIGLMLGWGSYLRNVTATGNVIRKSDIAIGVSVASGAGQAVVTGNIVSEAKRGAVVGMEWRKIATRDFGRDGEGSHANLTFGRNVVS